MGDIVSGCEERRGPVTRYRAEYWFGQGVANILFRTLKLLEAESGVITVKLDIQMF